jgi:hypothetical protein
MLQFTSKPYMRDSPAPPPCCLSQQAGYCGSRWESASYASDGIYLYIALDPINFQGVTAQCEAIITHCARTAAFAGCSARPAASDVSYTCGAQRGGRWQVDCSQCVYRDARPASVSWAMQPTQVLGQSSQARHLCQLREHWWPSVPHVACYSHTAKLYTSDA